MDYLTLIGHILQQIALFSAFLAAGLSICYANVLKGGTAGYAAKLQAIAFIFIAIRLFAVYIAITTGTTDLLSATAYWHAMNGLTLFAFVLLATAQYKMLKVVRQI